MSVTATLSSTFSITMTSTGAGAGFVFPGRACRIVAISANNNAAGAQTVDVIVGGTQITRGGPVGIAANSCEWVELNNLDFEVGGAETISVNPSGAAGDLDPICIYCVATGGGTALNVA